MHTSVKRRSKTQQIVFPFAYNFQLAILYVSFLIYIDDSSPDI